MIPNPYEKKVSPESIVLDILVRKPGITSKEAYDFFLAKYKSGMTLQGFYKIIRQLLNDRVVVKTGGRLSLYSAWIQNLVKFAERAAQTHFSADASKATILLDEGESKTFTFERVDEMDNFWDHALLTVSFYYKDNPKGVDRNAYSKNFYSWIQLLRTPDSTQLSYLYDQLNIEWHMASGSHTFLNQIVPTQLAAPNFHFALYDKLTGYGEGKDNFHVTVLGDFIFETQVPPFVFEIIKSMFETVKSLSELDLERFKALIHENARTTLKVSRDKKRAEKIRNEIKGLVK